MPDKRVRQDQLIEALYELALNPNNFDSFTEAWEQYLLENASGPDAEIPERLSRHFGRAFQILEKFGRENSDDNQTLDMQLEARELPSIAAELDGQIITLNSSARTLFKTGNSVPSLRDLVNKKSLELLLKGISRTISNHPFPMVVLLPDHQPALMLLQRLQLADSEIVIIDVAGSSWNVRMHSTLRSMYSLTRTESAVAALLYQGFTITEIAERENRAVSTIRQHTKSLLKKTQTHSQPRLMKLLTSFNFAQSNNEQVKWANSKCSNHILKLSDGRKYAYYDSGAAHKKVIVVLHGVLHDPELPDTMHHNLNDEGYRIIGPSRAWFGESSPPSNVANILEDSAEDLIELLDHLQIQSVTLLGNLAGGAHAYITAALYPTRVERIINIGGMVPLKSEQQLESMPKGVRAVIRTAKHFPKLLPTLIRTALALIDRGDIRRLFNTIYRASPLDISATKQDHVFQRLSIGYRFAARHGHGAYTYEGLALAQDFSHFLENMQCPCYLIHGEQDGIISMDTVNDFADTHNNVRVIQVKGAGQLIMYTHSKTLTRVLIENLIADK